MKRLQIVSVQSQGCLLCYELLCFSNILITLLIQHVAMPTSRSCLHVYVIISFGILNLHCLLPGLPGSGLIYKSLPCPSLLWCGTMNFLSRGCWSFRLSASGDLSQQLLFFLCDSSPQSRSHLCFWLSQLLCELPFYSIFLILKTCKNPCWPRRQWFHPNS